MIQKFNDSKIWIAFMGAVILICVLMNSCGENANASIKKTNTDSACQAGIKDAQQSVKARKYSVFISNMDSKLSSYAEEMFCVYYHKEVDVKNNDYLFDDVIEENDNARDNCYEHYMDSVVAAFGPDVYERIIQGAKNLYEKEPLRYSQPIPGVPQFPGGDSAMGVALQKTVHYPPAAKKDSVMGSVYVRIEIDSTGKVVNAKVLKGVRKDLDSAAVAGVMQLPDFLPTYERGKKISTSIVKPIRFTLK